jgi:cytochrome b6-f complex iron-sulfur subunit
MGTDRRDFIKSALYATLALFGLGFVLPGLALFAPVAGRTGKVVFFPLVPEEEIPRAGVKKRELVYTAGDQERRARVVLVSSGEGFTDFSATCSHLGCLVNYNKEKGQFECPCHGGRYDLSGKNVAGPPPAPLTQLPVRVEQGMLLVGIKVQAA